MRFLISNYSNAWNTESYYFNAGLNLIEGVKSEIFNSQQSVYDNFDRINPNVFITHLSQISKDVVHYISQNKKIKLVVNTNGIDPKMIENVNSALSSQNIDISFFGWDDIKIDKVKHYKILPGADIFLAKPQKQYSISKLIFVNSKDNVVDMEGTYHYATINQIISNDVDFFLPITVLNTIFSSYDEIVFKDKSCIGSQLSFNAIYSGTKVIFDTKDSSDLDRIDSIFKGQKLLSSVKNKHTCLHRLKSLLSQLSMSDLTNKMGDKIESI